MNRSAWLRRLGAAGGIAILMIPMVLVWTVTAKAASNFWLDLLDLAVLTTGGHRTAGPLVFHFGSHISWDLRLLLATLPAAVTIWMLAPFADYRRRDALMILLPVWNVLIMTKICARVVDVARVDSARSVRSHAHAPDGGPHADPLMSSR